MGIYLCLTILPSGSIPYLVLSVLNIKSRRPLALGLQRLYNFTWRRTYRLLHALGDAAVW
jgi:hypothetical protein